MDTSTNKKPPPDRCASCSPGVPLDFAFTFAFQPIVDVTRETIFSYEALVRGPNGESAAWVLGQINDRNRYRFDQACRVAAIALAARLGITTNVNINFMPNAVYQPENCIRTTFAASEKYGFPIERVIFEMVENDPLAEPSRLINILSEYKRFGFLTAIDDFGAGFRDISLLAEFHPDVLKLDMNLIRGIDAHAGRQAVVRGVIGMCRELGIRVLGEGVETQPEYVWLAEAGIELFQGYLFARPAFEEAQTVDFSAFRRCSAAA
jgi:EAL domain-containing protein (putative c-di-GMP-specific phosphodiesterase class I)